MRRVISSSEIPISMPRTKGTRGKKATSRRTDTSRTSERRLTGTKTSTTIPRGGKNLGGKNRPSSAGAVRATQKWTKRSNATAHLPRAKRQRLREQSPSTSEDEEGEVFDDAPLTKADIPKIVEAVMNQFPKESDDSQNQSQDNPHLADET